jgi:hypothetical protein
MVAQLVKKFPGFYRNRKFIAMFISVSRKEYYGINSILKIMWWETHAVFCTLNFSVVT